MKGILWMSWNGRAQSHLTSQKTQDDAGARNLPEVSTLSERFPDAVIDEMGALSDPNWPGLEI